MDEEKSGRSEETEAKTEKVKTEESGAKESGSKENRSEQDKALETQAKETGMRAKLNITPQNKRIFQILVGVLAVAVFALCCVGINSAATSVGRGVGNVSGAVVGAAVGSASGIKDGVTEGIQAGIEEGLSAEDTKVELGQAIQSVGKLEVLVAGVTLESINTIGNAYTGLYVIAGDAVFTVDLATTEVVMSADGSSLDIEIPEPELSLYLNQNSTEKLAEVQNFSWSVSAEDGLKEYLNSMAKTKEETQEYLSNYSELMESAKDAAITQVTQLASRLNVGGAAVNVTFREDTE